ncbi:MAG: hypothetical protein QG646_191, partial [Euryarchaeota archaeon]|nr:hypothetical protein [Euryarchaeota archaeon]
MCLLVLLFVFLMCVGSVVARIVGIRNFFYAASGLVFLSAAFAFSISICINDLER